MQGDLAQKLQEMGRDIAMPGVEMAIELLQELLADLRGKARQAAGEAAMAGKRGRPLGSKNAKKVVGGNSGWPTDPEERRIEAKRRMAVAKAKRGGKVKGLGHPRDPRHPGHDAWVKKMAESNRKHWRDLTPQKKRERIGRMLTNRGKTARGAVEELKATA